MPNLLDKDTMDEEVINIVILSHTTGTYYRKKSIFFEDSQKLDKDQMPPAI